MIRIKEKGRIITVVSSSWNFKFNVFMGDIFLLKIHAAEKDVFGHNAARSEGERGNPPDDPHQLTSYDGITAICADTEVKPLFEFLARTGVQDRYHAAVEIYGHSLMLEKDTNGLDS
jgi:hypothetical protein